MKIALCGRFNTEKKHQGGSAEVFLALAKGLSKNNEVTLFGRGEPTEDIKKMCRRNNIKFYYIPSDSIMNILLGPFRALKLMKKHWDDFDVVHTHTGSFAWASTFFRKKSKIITHVHQYLPLSNSSLIIKTYFYLEKYLLKQGAKNSHLTITIAKYIKQIIEKEWKLENVLVIPNGIDLKSFKFKKIKKNKNVFEMLYVGRLSNQKNIDKLIGAIQLLKFQVSFNIVGDGEEEYNLKKLVSNKSLDNIIFHGRKSGKDLLNLYRHADIFLLASDFEGQPLVLLEAMATRTPIIASDVLGTHELIQNIGILVNPPTSENFAKEIDKLIENPRLREKLAKKGLKEVKKYSWDKIIKQIEKIYKEIRK